MPLLLGGYFAKDGEGDVLLPDTNRPRLDRGRSADAAWLEHHFTMVTGKLALIVATAHPDAEPREDIGDPQPRTAG